MNLATDYILNVTKYSDSGCFRHNFLFSLIRKAVFTTKLFRQRIKLLAEERKPSPLENVRFKCSIKVFIFDLIS